jgi:hypothetical protein
MEVGDGAVHSVSDLGLFLQAVAYCENHYDTSKIVASPPMTSCHIENNLQTM